MLRITRTSRATKFAYSEAWWSRMQRLVRYTRKRVRVDAMVVLMSHCLVKRNRKPWFIFNYPPNASSTGKTIPGVKKLNLVFYLRIYEDLVNTLFTDFDCIESYKNEPKTLVHPRLFKLYRSAYQSPEVVEIRFSRDCSIKAPRVAVYELCDFFKTSLTYQSRSRFETPDYIDLCGIIDESKHQVIDTLLSCSVLRQILDEDEYNRTVSLSMDDFVQALLLDDVLQFSEHTVKILQHFASKSIVYFDDVGYFLQRLSVYGATCTLSSSLVEKLSSWPVFIFGYRYSNSYIEVNTLPLYCGTCEIDFHTDGFCNKCKFATFCLKCSEDSRREEINLEYDYKCEHCDEVQKMTREDFARLEGNDWKLQVFKCFLLPYWILVERGGGNDVDLKSLKKRVGFELKEIPRQLYRNESRMVKEILPILEELVRC